MRFVIAAPPRLVLRAELPVVILRKAFSRGPTVGHKYIRRERAFVGGKMTWRYYYRDEKQRTEHALSIDPHRRHEHRTLAEVAKIYPHLGGALVRAVDATVDALRRLFGLGDKKRLTATPGWRDRVHGPAIVAEERAPDSAGRSPNARVQRALELIPGHLKELVAQKSGRYAGLGDVQLELMEEDPFTLQARSQGAIVAGWASKKGQLRITEAAVTTASGRSYFGSPQTLTEEVVVHEFGHHVHFALEDQAPQVIEEWQRRVHDGPEPKISNYAWTNWKEDWAETFACALSQPKELAQKCPDRYDFMRKHVIPELRPREQVARIPDEELAWWNPAPQTPATRALNQMRQDQPARKFYPYYSARDQFYIVSKGGRSCYLRFGPPDKQAEAGWERMPPTIDPETGLPRYEGSTYTRFNGYGALKEIYDQGGHALDSKQAWLYLGQDDEKVIAQVQKVAGDNPNAYGSIVAEKGAEDISHLGRKMFDSLGGNIADNTLEKERARVARARARGETGVLERHEWTPVEITAQEFIEKSGTFKFGGVAEAPDQPHVIYDIVDGRRVARTYFDAAEQRHKPVLAVRVYEQVNPDGTRTRIRVHEDASFSAGEAILAPVRVAREDEHGVPRQVTEWQRYQLRESDSTEPEELARQLGTTARELLERNQRYGRGQIIDPVMSALINPGGRRQIRCAQDLQELMRVAAESDPPRRAWVSIVGGSAEVGAQAVSHVEVEWDGAGPPRVVGDYWARKLGKSEIRIDELLDKKDEIKLERIRERRPRDRKVGVGAVVWATDPKSRRLVMCRVIEMKRVDDKLHYQVQALSGQGAGISRGVVSVTRVRATTEADVPGQAHVQRRLVEPLRHDVLLYADEVPKDAGPLDPGGVIRILMPTDGSVTYEQLKRLPGVQAPRRPESAGLAPTLGIAVEDIPRFRAALGGFVMDGRVRAMLDRAIQTERGRQEQREAEPVVRPEQIVDDVGNINPDGVLRGLVTGSEGIQPGSHRIKALMKLAQSNGRLIAAHFMGTGKTAFAIMAAQMMRNLTDRDGNPHSAQSRKKTIVVVPLNTAENWYQEYKKFAGEPPTLLGASTLAGAQQLPRLPERRAGESDGSYQTRAIADWKAQCRDKPNLWNPFADASRNVVIGSEYFRDHEEALRLTELFDGMIVDEAHEIARENETSRAVERWNPQMNIWLGLTGTPIMNTLDVVPRLVRLVTANRVDLGSEEQFAAKYLMPSAVLRAHGAVNPPRIDINPMRAGELAAILQPLMDVATTADVKGQSMPAVLLDENQPAHMIGQQARMYRAAMARLTDEEREQLALSASLGLDEKQLLTEEARARVEVARSVANCPAYKAPDAREELLYRARVPQTSKKGEVRLVEQMKPFRLPTARELTATGPGGWRGHWPSASDVAAGRIEEGYYGALVAYADHLFGRDYSALEGAAIEPAIIEAIKKGTYVTGTGQAWGARIANPDYGPEGVIARGELGADGIIEPMTYRWTDEHGNEEVRQVPTGTVFVRDPNSKAAGLFYHQDDWDFTGRFADTGESSPGAEVPETEDATPARRARGQAPKPGREGMSIQRSPARREQRAQFDVAVTRNNAKCDKLEAWMRNVLSGKTGDPNPDTAQFIVFGNRIGSSVRTVESKLRTMGYQDVNEALGPAEYSSDGDKARCPRKYFVSYMGKGATLGDRNLNSEIFRRVQDQFGKDVGSSVFVWRTLYGSSGKALRLGEVREGWGRTERRTISECFVDRGDALEVPMRVRGAAAGESVVPEYVYESDLRPRERAEVRDIEVRLRGASPDEKRELSARLSAVLEPHYTRRAPLSERAMHVLNNCQVMVASDAANVGLNWPAGYLGMYDSLFSPMGEWQRITRAARMLPPSVSRGMRPIVDKLDKFIADYERENPGIRSDRDDETAMSIMQKAIGALDDADRGALAQMEGGRAEQLIEAYFARRALDRIAGLREQAEQRLRTEGYYPDPSAPRTEENWIPPVAVTEVDVNNYIVRELLGPFEKKMMKARRYLVDVQRFTTSVDMPLFKTVVRRDAEGGKTRVRVPELGSDGKPIYVTESPSAAERSQLTQQRAKQRSYEFFMKMVQNATPSETQYDFVAANQRSLALTSLSSDRQDNLVDYLANEGVHYATELAAPGAAKKSLVVPVGGPRLVVRPARMGPPLVIIK